MRNKTRVLIYSRIPTFKAHEHIPLVGDSCGGLNALATLGRLYRYPAVYASPQPEAAAVVPGHFPAARDHRACRLAVASLRSQPARFREDAARAQHRIYLRDTPTVDNRVWPDNRDEAAEVMFVEVYGTTAPTYLTAAEAIDRIETMGYTNIHDFNVEWGVYEVEAIAPEGNEVEIEFDPVTGALLEVEDNWF